jgi:signal transduction histidine kinase
VIQDAGRRAFASCAVASFAGLEEAKQQFHTEGDEVLVLPKASAGDKEAASQILDSQGLVRWAVVVLPHEGELEAEALAQTFREGAARHALQRENQRLRGDLKTVARRVTHDLRSPLGGIVSTADMLKEILSETDPQSGAMADPLFRSVDSVVSLIERVGVLLNATAQPMLPGKVAMATAVSNTLQRLERLTLEKKVKVQTPPDWPEAQGVQNWVELIWWNLIRNALLHAEGLTRIELGCGPRDGACRFFVHDDGPGVPEARRSKLFQPFHLLHEHGSAKGLGLATVQRLVEMQGGACGYEPTQGGGACFWFELPVSS